MNAEQERDAAVERIEVVLTTTALAGLFWPKVRKAITAELEAAELRGYERAKADDSPSFESAEVKELAKRGYKRINDPRLQQQERGASNV